MKTTIEINVHTRHDEIAALTKLIWEREGHQSGRVLEYWLRAERQVLSAGDPTNHIPTNRATTNKAQPQGKSKNTRLPDLTTGAHHS
jgi:hypothetical protein